MPEVFDVEQGSDAWLAARLGIPTASRFADVLAKGEGKMRGKYLNELAAERLRGTAEESYTNAHMERGSAQEEEARDLYAFTHRAELRQVGFIIADDRSAGCSPDSLIGEDGGLEIKSALGHIQIERIRRGTLPSEHRAQVQGNLWVTGRQWWHFVSYSPGLPLFVVKVERDEEYIVALAKAVAAFNAELASIVDAIRTYENPRKQMGLAAA